MEESRLHPMRADYDVALFNSLYQKTEGLRRKLASEIDCKRFRVDYYEVLSWFDIKFIYVFNKYYESKQDKLLGYLINSLKTFKLRILRVAYTEKYTQNIVNIGDIINFSDLETENVLYEEEKEPNEYYELSMEFLKQKLSPDAFLLLQTQLSPSPYIIERMKEQDLHNLNKIPNPILLEYFGLGECDKSIKYIKKLKREINDAISLARYHFQNN